MGETKEDTKMAEDKVEETKTIEGTGDAQQKSETTEFQSTEETKTGAPQESTDSDGKKTGEKTENATESKTEEKTEETKQSPIKPDKKQNGSAEKEDLGEMTDLEKKIVKQLEYYFGDMNLTKDKFLQAELKKDSGFVEIKVLLTFNRLRSLSEDPDLITLAIRKSKSSILELNEDRTKIRRSVENPLPLWDEKFTKEVRSKSIYIKGFPRELSLDTLEAFLNTFGEVQHIQMRRDADKNFKGSVFVVFKEIDDAKKLVEAEDVKYEGNELIRMLRLDYYNKKKDEFKKIKEKQHDDEESKKEEQEKGEDENLEKRITKGAVLSLGDLPEGLTFGDLKDKFGKYGEVAYVEYTTGGVEGCIRFTNENEAPKALEKFQEEGEGKTVVNDKEIKAHVLEGEEEINYWRRLFNNPHRQRNKRSKRGRGKHGGGPPAKKRRN